MVKVEESQVWVPAEEPIASRAFLLNSKIWEMCQELPIHWISPSPLRGEAPPPPTHTHTHTHRLQGRGEGPHTHTHTHTRSAGEGVR